MRGRYVPGLRGLQDELDEGPHLGRRVLPRRVQRAQGKDLAGPIGKEIDEPAGGEKRLDSDTENLRDACPGETFVDHSADIAQLKAPLRLDGNDPLARPKLPFIRARGDGIEKLDAFVRSQVGRVLRLAVLLDVRRRGGREDPRLRRL